MVNKIIDGISNAIYKEFGDGYDIYTESIEQGLQEPCFSILCISPTNELFLGKRYKRTNQFMVQYFPSSSEPYNECNSTMERLFDCLEYIELDGDLIRGTGGKGQIVDGVLNYQIDYDFFTHKMTTRDDAMESYKVNNNVGKG